MRNNKLITALTAAIISSGFLASCSHENNKVADNTRSMNPEDQMGVGIDVNTGTRHNIDYNQEEEESTTTQSRATTQTVNGKEKPVPNGDPKLMDNPSAVQHASEQANRKNNASIHEPVYVNQKEGYVTEPDNNTKTAANPVNSQVNTADNRAVSGSGSEYVAQGNNSPATTADTQSPNSTTRVATAKTQSGYLAQKNMDITQYLKGQVNDLIRKENELSTKVKDAKFAPTYKPGVKNPRGPAGSAIQSELASYRSQRVKAQQQIAGLQKDNKNNYQATQQFLMNEKNNFVKMVTAKLPEAQKHLGSNASAQQAYKQVQSSLAKLKTLAPGQELDKLQQQTLANMRKLDPAFAKNTQVNSGYIMGSPQQ
jgi:hypothetical protein